MICNVAGKNLIKSFESCRLESYQDQKGIWTIGWGKTAGLTQGMSCTQEQADEWFEESISEFEKILSNMIMSRVNPNQFSACVSLAYNIGTGHFGSSTVLTMIHAERYDLAADAFLLWKICNGEIDPGLLRRREAERALFLSNVF